MRISLLAAIFVAGFVGVACTVWAQNEPTPQGVLAIAKMAGACGILDSQIGFQKSTQMPGGDGFVVRFWTVEATRLGMTMQQYSNQCNDAIAAYDKLWKAMESNKR